MHKPLSDVQCTVRAHVFWHVQVLACYPAGCAADPGAGFVYCTRGKSLSVTEVGNRVRESIASV